MSEFTVWDSRSGEVVRIGNCPDSMVENQVRSDAPWERVCPGKIDYEAKWHDGSKWASKRIIKPKVRGTTVSGLPVPSTCFVESDSYVIDDGVADFEFGQPGVYKVRITSPGHKEVVVEVQA